MKAVTPIQLDLAMRAATFESLNSPTGQGFSEVADIRVWHVRHIALRTLAPSGFHFFTRCGGWINVTSEIRAALLEPPYRL